MRLRRTLIGTGASLAALAVIYFGVVAYLQATSKHLRLGNANNDRVEIYTGTSKFPDPFGQQHYFSETSVERGQLELDKRYPRRDIPDYPLVVRDLIGSQPLDARVTLYISNGELCQYSDLLTQILPIDRPSPGCQANSNRPRATELSSKETSKPSIPSANPSLSPDTDPMLQTMLMRLPELQTQWAFEQAQMADQLFPQFNASMGGNFDRTGLNLPTSYTKERLLEKALTQMGSATPDPRQIELLLNWMLDPSSVAATAQTTRPVDAATSLTDSARNSPKSILPTLIQVLQLKPRFLQALASDNLQQREVAAILAGATADPSFFEPLAKLLNEKASTTRQYALKSLFAVDPERTIPLAAKLLSDRTQSNELRINVFMILAETASLKAMPALLERFQDPNEREELRMVAGSTLGNLGDATVLPALRAVLSDQNERNEARLGAIEGLKNLNDQASTELLLERLNDVEERLDVRNSCATALGELAPNAATASLLALAEDQNAEENLRSAAASALNNADSPDIV
ncbi:MAG TPA: HEAT repeat domain-containing protein, partial [Thiolinea sp.]|nr:HEAT repeat domain-containing protein [Thiolinea sp.]